MIRQCYEKLFPKAPEPRGLTPDEQRALAKSAWRLEAAIREYLYCHREGGSSDKFDELGIPGHKKNTCSVCRELDDALGEA